MAETSKVGNFKQMMGNDKQRNVWIVCVVVAVLTIGVGFYMATRNKSAGPGAGAQIAAVPAVNSVPGASDNPAYNGLVADRNKDATKAAIDGGKSFVPTITNSGNGNSLSPLDLIDKEAEARKKAAADERKRLQDEEEAKKVVPPPVPPPIYQPVIQPQPVYQPVVQPQPVAPPRPRAGFTSDDSAIVSSLVNMWRIKPSKMEMEMDKMQSQVALSGAAANVATATSSTAATDAKDELVLAKAGTILNAVLETGINSDEPSPVLAKIVTGEFAGSRVMGQMTKTGEKVVVQFNNFSIPKYPRSMTISAVAVDPDNARTGLATDVDRHYFARFGLTLGAAFISGYAEAIGRQNISTTNNPLGGTTVVQGALSGAEIVKSAMGKVGQAVATDVAKHTPSGPTITVEAGTAIGVLLMTDLVTK